MLPPTSIAITSVIRKTKLNLPGELLPILCACLHQWYACKILCNSMSETALFTYSVHSIFQARQDSSFSVPFLEYIMESQKLCNKYIWKIFKCCEFDTISLHSQRILTIMEHIFITKKSLWAMSLKLTVSFRIYQMHHNISYQNE